MKLGYVLKKFPRLSETFILNELLGLEAMGHEIVVFSLRNADDEPRHAGLKSLKARIVILPTSSSFHVAEVSQQTKSYVTTLAPGRQRKTLAQGLGLAKMCQDLGIEHLHAHFMTVASHVAAVARLNGGPSFSVTAHAKDIFRTEINTDLFRATAALASSLVTVSHYNKNFINRRFFDGRDTDIKVIYNGLPLRDLDVVGASPPRESATILAVGRLVEKKGFDLLLRACSDLKQRGRQFRVIVVGQGDQSVALEDLARELDLGDRVTFLGALPREEVVRLMHTSQMFVLPCRQGKDGNSDALPTVLIEALTCGLPVISTKFVGIPEIIVDGKSGLLVPTNDVRALGTAITTFLDDPAMLQRFSVAGRKRAQSVFDREITLPRLVEVFHKNSAALKSESR